MDFQNHIHIFQTFLFRTCVIVYGTFAIIAKKKMKVSDRQSWMKNGCKTGLGCWLITIFLWCKMKQTDMNRLVNCCGITIQQWKVVLARTKVTHEISLFFIIEFWILSWRRSLLYRNQAIDLQSKSMDWFLYDRDLHHERVNTCHRRCSEQQHFQKSNHSLYLTRDHHQILLLILSELQASWFASTSPWNHQKIKGFLMN